MVASFLTLGQTLLIALGATQPASPGGLGTTATPLPVPARAATSTMAPPGPDETDVVVLFTGEVGGSIQPCG